jgi:ClpA/ClpB-like protein
MLLAKVFAAVSSLAMSPDPALAPILPRLTGQARSALAAALHEARNNQDDYVGTEHVLLGLLDETETGAGALIRLLNVDPERLQRQVRLLLQSQTHGAGVGTLPLTPGARRALSRAADEADELHQAHIGPEHLLLGLSREEESLAHFLLEEAGVDTDALRSAVPRLPPHENRDHLVQSRGPGKRARPDPTLEELGKLMFGTGEIAVPRAAPLPHSQATPVSTSVPSVAGDHENLTRILASTQLLLGLFMGTAIGAVWGTWRMVLCMFAGAAIALVRSSWLGALGGAGAGYGLARVLCPGQMSEALFVILIAILAGIFVGNGPLRLLTGYRGGWTGEKEQEEK